MRLREEGNLLTVAGGSNSFCSDQPTVKPEPQMKLSEKSGTVPRYHTRAALCSGRC